MDTYVKPNSNTNKSEEVLEKLELKRDVVVMTKESKVQKWILKALTIAIIVNFLLLILICGLFSNFYSKTATRSEVMQVTQELINISSQVGPPGPQGPQGPMGLPGPSGKTYKYYMYLVAVCFPRAISLTL